MVALVARVCVEIDLRNPLVQGFWVSVGGQMHWIEVEYEGRMEFCRRCRKHGHSVEECRKEQARRSRNEEGIKGVSFVPPREKNWKGDRDNGSVLKCPGFSEDRNAPIVGASQPRRVYDGRNKSKGVPVKKFYRRKEIPENDIQNLVAESEKVVVSSPSPIRDHERGVVSLKGGQCKETRIQNQMHSDQRLLGLQPELYTRTSVVSSPFMTRLQDSLEEFMIRMYDLSRPNVAPTAYNRMISMDDSELGKSSAIVEYTSKCAEEEVLPLQICESSDSLFLEENKRIAAKVASLRQARDQDRRMTRSATKLSSSSTKSC